VAAGLVTIADRPKRTALAQPQPTQCTMFKHVHLQVRALAKRECKSTPLITDTTLLMRIVILWVSTAAAHSVPIGP